jgi:hypothetical protein
LLLAIAASVPVAFLLARDTWNLIKAAVIALVKQDPVRAGQHLSRGAGIGLHAVVPVVLTTNYGGHLLSATGGLTDIDISGAGNLAIVDDHLGAAIPVDAIFGDDPTINEDTNFLIPRCGLIDPDVAGTGDL